MKVSELQRWLLAAKDAFITSTFFALFVFVVYLIPLWVWCIVFVLSVFILLVMSYKEMIDEALDEETTKKPTPNEWDELDE